MRGALAAALALALICGGAQAAESPPDEAVPSAAEAALAQAGVLIAAGRAVDAFAVLMRAMEALP